MKPKDGFVKGPCKGFSMHVTSSNSKASMVVNPLRIVVERCDQKEAMSSASEMLAAAAAAAAAAESADIESALRPSSLPPNSSSPSLSIPPELFRFSPTHMQQQHNWGPFDEELILLYGLL
ncbi:hypothetical protein PIB30_053134 [Stylosanthes scabra]|uniref:Uncharacterized protein n=1 Tax=Stylosanthes scabra TaxID=79078 RepID=A0ABU6YJL1_9FABA|nr:hypothetical protein [Stylosanthes scabra]